MCMSDLTDHMYAWCQQRSEDDIGSPGTSNILLWATKWVLETEPTSAAPSLSDS